MICRNCGSQLTEGAKFCSECGTKVEDVQVREFDNLEIEEPASVTDTLASEPIGADEAFNSRVSFDWSNVIDEPQKKEIPQGIKSPWASTTGSIDERMIYSEMTPSDDKNRTMSFIDVLKADKEERERAALDRSIEYTEVLEIDPEVVGGTKPPTLHSAPLYDDVDEPVVTPFDDIEPESVEPVSEETYEASSEAEEENTSAPKFELPDFLKNAGGFEADKTEEEQLEMPANEVASTEEKDAFAADDKTLSETVETVEDGYLDEDIYLELEERPSDEARMSRVYTHTLAGDYDFGDDEEENEEAIDEEALFEEIGSKETLAPGKTGMTIAAPADEEAEVEALKRRLAELTGTVEIDPALLDEAEASTEEEAEPVFEDFTFEPEITESDDALFAGLTAASETTDESKPAAPDESIEYASDGSIEDLYLSDEFSFEPEITEADDALFAGLTAASETTNGSIEDNAETSFGLSEGDELIVEEFSESEPDSEPIVETKPEAEPIVESKEEAVVEQEPVVESEPATESEKLEAEVDEPSVEDLLAKYVPQYFGDEASSEVEEVEEVETEPEKPVSFGLADFEEKDPVPDVDSFAADIEEPKPTDAVSLEELEKDIFGDAPNEEAEAETTKKIDKFYTLYRKNEEFQRLLDEEYSRLKGEHIEVEEDDLPVVETAGDTVETLNTEPVLEEIAADTKPVEDATIYRMEMPEELAEIAEKAENVEKNDSGFSVGGEGAKSFGLSGDEVAGAAAAGVAAVAAGAAATSKADKKAEKKAAKQAEKQKKKDAAAKDDQVEYEDVDAGSTILTVLAVIIAILLVILLVIILILHIAPGSSIALTINDIIGRLTGGFGSGDIFGFNKWV